MLIQLFTLDNGVVIPSTHCYNLKDLNNIIKKYPKDYIKILSYIYYMTCPSVENPFFNMLDNDKEDEIIQQLELKTNLDDETIIKGLNLCKKLYETPTLRAYNGIKTALDNIADYMITSKITGGKDGNITQIGTIAQKFNEIRESYKGTYEDLEKEQKKHVRGDINLAYDQM